MNNLPLLRPISLGRAGRLLLVLLALAAGACQKTKPTAETATSKATQAAYYTCSMHPQIHADGPGSCPICHMDLIQVQPVPAAAPVAKKPLRPLSIPAPCTRRCARPSPVAAPSAGWIW
ncbi:MAG: hypothetical protein EOO59_09835 [Hymenobacter sp.]|nr:MAG: hypothetical protein EOO59_09835 [Hymenobacter sp.]